MHGFVSMHGDVVKDYNYGLLTITSAQRVNQSLVDPHHGLFLTEVALFDLRT